MDQAGLELETPSTVSSAEPVVAVGALRGVRRCYRARSLAPWFLVTLAPHRGSGLRRARLGGSTPARAQSVRASGAGEKGWGEADGLIWLLASPGRCHQLPGDRVGLTEAPPTWAAPPGPLAGEAAHEAGAEWPAPRPRRRARTMSLSSCRPPSRCTSRWTRTDPGRGGTQSRRGRSVSC